MKKSIRKIPLFKAHIAESTLKPLEKVIRSGYVSEGEVSHRFEKKFQDYIGNPFISMVNSGTSALTLALRMAGVGEGDEVISTPMTCLATNEPIMLTEAKIVWADIDLNNGNIDPKSVEKRITSRTKAVMVVHWAGNPVDIGAISKLAKKHKLVVIEDAAHALGAKYKGRLIGNHSDFICFSFQAIKHLTTVDGGAIAARNKKDYERLRLLRWYGCSRNHTKNPIKWKGDVLEPGYKMHMNDVNAVIGIEQLKYINGIIAKHKKNAAYLANSLKGVEEIELPRTVSGAESSYWIFTIKLPNPEYRKKFSEALSARGVGNGIVHQRNDKYSLFKKFQKSDLPGVNDFCSRMLNIPCGWWLSKGDLDYMIRNIKEVVWKIRR